MKRRPKYPCVNHPEKQQAWLVKRDGREFGLCWECYRELAARENEKGKQK